ncbi:hypothetical protein GMRT_11916 [Giardia muris]|uniref:Uncharacterized protein n=1 Tax=Giardia muris TaxID=5742 RepID=A0A4Z1SRZ1_GIAMU|nr:hypothetical protein GMRT_11916 [Giardia muris]|eukprot:TNJ28530.1 hypothetical protein GMRT_11916 [Giardia muris]
MQAQPGSKGKVRRISYVSAGPVVSRGEQPKRGQPVICNEMRDHVAILPSTGSRGRAYVRGVEYLLDDCPTRGPLRPAHCTLRVVQADKENRRAAAHYPEAATLCAVGEDYIPPAIRMYVPRPISARVLSRTSIDSSSALVMSKRPTQEKTAMTLNAVGGNKFLRRVQSMGTGLARGAMTSLGSGTFTVTEMTPPSAETPISILEDQSIDVTIYRDPYDLAREQSCAKNTAIIDRIEHQAAGEAHRLQSTALVRGPSKLGIVTDCRSLSPVDTTTLQRSTGRTTEKESVSDLSQKPSNSHSPCRAFESFMPSSSGILPLSGALVQEHDLSVSPPPIPPAYGKQTPNPPGGEFIQSSLALSALGTGQRSRGSSMVVPPQEFQGYGLSPSPVPSFSRPQIAPTPQARVIAVEPTSQKSSLPIDIDTMMQSRNLDDGLSFGLNTKVQPSCTATSNPESMLLYSSTAPGVALPAKSGSLSVGTPLLPRGPRAHSLRPRTPNSVSFSSRRQLTIINDSEVIRPVTHRPTSRKQVTKAQPVHLGPGRWHDA